MLTPKTFEIGSAALYPFTTLRARVRRSTVERGEDVLGICLLLALLAFVAWFYLGGRDAGRRQNLDLLRQALESYASSNGGSYQTPAGANGSGQGWVSLKYENHPSIVSFLYAKRFLKSEALDDKNNPNYMLYLCDAGKRFSLSATLDNPSQADIDFARTTCNALGTNGTVEVYHKNYAIQN